MSWFCEVAMRYAILLRQFPDGTYEAIVPAIPGLTATGTTRDETLRSTQQAIVTTVETVEVVYLDIPNGTPSPVNPWLTTAGMFADDPTLELMLDQIYSDRDE